MNTNELVTLQLSKPLIAFAQPTFVVCPSCHGPAQVDVLSRLTPPPFLNQGKVVCFRCSFVRVAPSAWFGPMVGYVRQQCGQCGYRQSRHRIKQEHTSQSLPATIPVTCPACSHQAARQIEWLRAVSSDSAIDLTFGLPLWLQTNCCNHILWAYNKEHILALKTYIASKQRGQCTRSKWSMITRLPQWMKSAKHRLAILKGLDQLDERLHNTIA